MPEIVSTANLLRAAPVNVPVIPFELSYSDEIDAAILKFIEIIAEKKAADTGTNKDSEIFNLARNISENGLIYQRDAAKLLTPENNKLLISRLGQQKFEEYSAVFKNDEREYRRYGKRKSQIVPNFVVRSRDIAYALYDCTIHGRKWGTTYCLVDEGTEKARIAYPRSTS
jgi:hypothetical protein